MDETSHSERWGQPSVCLNMIVRNESHIITQLFDTIAPYIHDWVIVDTGSEDGTQDVIRGHMAELGIPGELHERPWKNFGHNRTEALQLAQGHADYIWVMDADDLLVGTLDLSGLESDAGLMRIESPGVSYWRMLLFRDGMPFRYEGVVHEFATCDVPFTNQRLDGDYVIESRRLGGRNMDPQKYHRDIELLRAEVERNPNDARSVFYIARSYNSLADWQNARAWYAKRAEMGGWEEEVFYSLWRVATATEMLGEAEAEVQEAYLRAWEYRPSRAEPLHDLAAYFRRAGHYLRGHLYAQRAASISVSNDDTLFVNPDVYLFRSVDEQAVCASGIGMNDEALDLCRRLLTIAGIPEADRKRIADNRNAIAQELLQSAAAYPAELVTALTRLARNADLTVTLTAGSDAVTAERTLNSFLRCCSDIQEVGQFLIIDRGLSEVDRDRLAAMYPFLEFSNCPAHTSVKAIREKVNGRYWLDLAEGWRFAVPDLLISRLRRVLHDETDVFAVGVNFGDSDAFITGPNSPIPIERGMPGYLLTATLPTGPAMFDISRTDRYLNGQSDLGTATLDEVFCVKDY